MKKVLALTLAVVLAFGMASVAFAADLGVKITDAEDNFYYGLNTPLGRSLADNIPTPNGTSGKDWIQANGGYYYMGDITADTKLELYMDVLDFKWEDASGTAQGGSEAPSRGLTSSHLSRASIKIRKSSSKGSSVIDDITLKSGSKNSIANMYIKIQFVETYLATSDTDFDFRLYLTKSGTKMDETEINISGTMAMDKIELDEDDDYVDLSDGSIAEASEYIRNIEIYAGNGLSMTANLFKDQKYYAYTHQEITAADDAVMAEYPEIDAVIYFQTNVSGNRKVNFDVSGTYYVYNADGEYIGTTAEDLPYSSKYYLASSRIELTGSGTDDVDDGNDIIYDDSDDGDATYVPSTPSGGDDYVGNEYDNPGTGSNGFVNVAVCAGVIALAAAAVSFKK